MEIIVGFSRYPTEKIARNSHDYRPLGLGYANLGALLMASSLPYDSPEGRNYAGAITSLMCGEAYAMSARMARRMGPFAGYARNAAPMLGVIRQHHAAAFQSSPQGVSPELYSAQKAAWDEAMEACQPFLSGAISKTVNMPSSATVEDIENAYLEAWKRGLKAIAVYRNGCKRTQPLNT
jgi:ribonucleotide reductase alpha subunit